MSKTPTPALSPSPTANLHIRDGTVLVGGDAHYWPGVPTTGHRAIVWAARKLKPSAIILIGDMLDATTISRYPPLGWETVPTLKEELDVAQERLEEIIRAAPKAKRFWTLGNHDARFDNRLAFAAKEFRGIAGTSLLDHFPEWHIVWAVHVGGDRGAVVKHRARGGLHASHNNTLWLGRTVVTGHLHQQRVSPLTDLNGTRWGVDCGMLADPRGRQFAYLEETPTNWRSGFAVLTWQEGQLLPPELVSVVEEEAGTVAWRGELIRV